MSDDEWEEYMKQERAPKTTGQSHPKTASAIKQPAFVPPQKAQPPKKQGSMDSWDMDDIGDKKSGAQTIDFSKPAMKQSSNAIRCMKSYIGYGDEFRVKGMKRKACKNLICGDCGISVSKYEGNIWDESKCNYLFYRANFGDYGRLKAGLISTPLHAAYCCGCKGYSVSDGEEMPPGYNWKCTGCDL